MSRGVATSARRSGRAEDGEKGGCRQRRGAVGGQWSRTTRGLVRSGHAVIGAYRVEQQSQSVQHHQQRAALVADDGQRQRQIKEQAARDQAAFIQARQEAKNAERQLKGAMR